MFRKLSLLLLSSTLLAGVSSLSLAQEEDAGSMFIDTTCQDLFDLFEEATEGEDKDPEDVTKARDDILYLAVWTHGYLSGKQGIDMEARPLSAEGLETLVGQMADQCEPDLEQLFVDAIAAME